MRKDTQPKKNKLAASEVMTFDGLTSKTIDEASAVLTNVCKNESLDTVHAFCNESIDELYEIGQILADRVELHEISELGTVVHPVSALVIDICLLALAYCGKCKVKISEGDIEGSILAALEARFYAGRAFGLASSGLEDITGSIIDEINSNLSAFKSDRARTAALARNATDEKRKAIAAVRAHFLEWKKTPDSWKSKAAFARDMCAAYPVLESSKHIENQCKKWEKEAA